MAIDMNTDETVPSKNWQVHPGHDPEEIPEMQPAPKQTLVAVWILLVLGLIAVVVAIVWGIGARMTAEHRLEDATKAAGIMTVNVVHPSTAGTTAELALPGNTQAFNDTPIYARTSGYLKQWFVDIGQHVKQGQLMATIETPEIDEQLQVSQANLQSAQADLSLANTTSERYQNLLKSDSVSKQETDVAVSGAAAKQAAVDAAAANVRRLEQLQSFEKVYAPYSGVVTARDTDIGALINAGSGSTSDTAKELFRIASVNELRVFVPVPETYASSVRDGDTATLTLDEYPDQIFTGKVTRNSNAFDQSTRTLNVEVDVDNADGKLLPGAYVFVHFKIPEQVKMLSLPANALIFRAQGLQVAMVRDGKVHLQKVSIGKDNGATLEMASGVGAGDQIILNPSDSIYEGEPVAIGQVAK